MNFEWRKPDGTEVAIRHPDEITVVMNDLKVRHDAAKNAGSRMTAAAIKLQYDDQFKQWCECMAHLFLDEQKELNAILNRMKQTLAWWDELSSHEAGDDALSELQNVLLADVPADLMPASWATATKIINSVPEFRPPSDSLDGDRARLAEQLSVASSCLQLAESLKIKFWNGEKPRQDEIETFHAKRAQLEKGLANAAGL